jgi:non-ribosomal peptide synthetase component F
MQYADYAIWQRNWLQGDALEEQLAFWRKQLAGIPESIDWAVESPRPSSPAFRAAYEPLTISRALTDSLKALSRREGLTLYMTLMSALQALIYRTTGQADVVIGAPGGARIHSEFESLIGAFVNTLPIRTNFSGEPSFRRVMKSVRETILEAHAHQEVPMAKVVQEVLPERSLQHNPLFQVVLVAGMGDPTGRYLASGVNILNIDTGVSKYDLVLTLRDTEDGLLGRMTYNADVFDVVSIRQMSGGFEELLEDIVANPDQRIANLPAQM